ncbi:hypothetical protein GOP47_0028805 [Adiantum capillus-veneris]|nr:hypothetical protein GOP47_0028805 [Adiantum capillus-veneris]
MAIKTSSMLVLVVIFSFKSSIKMYQAMPSSSIKRHLSSTMLLAHEAQMHFKKSLTFSVMKTSIKPNTRLCISHVMSSLRSNKLTLAASNLIIIKCLKAFKLKRNLNPVHIIFIGGLCF